jgi:hypothetical protein
VLERKVEKPNGEPLPRKWIGLRSPNTEVRASLGEELHKYLEGMAEWFEYLEDYRHALAHRIPLYIPQHAVDPRNEGRYHDLQATITRLIMQGQLAAAEPLERELNSLKFFRPFIMHSWAAGATPMVIHSQMLTDFNTIEEISAKILGELTRRAAQ